MINYDTQKSALEAQMKALDAAQNDAKAKTDAREGRMTLSFHPSDSLIEIATKLNALVGELGYGVETVAVPDRTVLARSNPDAEQRTMDRSIFAPASQLEKEQVRVATGQSAGPATMPAEASGGVVGVREIPVGADAYVGARDAYGKPVTNL